MPAARICPQCGAPLPDDGWDGLCPKCLVRVSIETPVQREKSKIQNPKSEMKRVRYFGDYELLEEIARGGMGVVYKARQVSLNRLVAVKMLLFREFSSPEFVRRFRTEAEAAASLQHPNIVAIHEIGEHEGQHYFSMDYVPGKNLAQVISELRFPSADFQKAARCVEQIAEAIHYAHQRGVLHRDLKPSNVLIDEFDQPRITDFGLAKRLASTSDLALRTSNLTVTGQVLGSPNFMPPEQAGGKRGEIGAYSDIYSLGAILFHLVTGRPPFVAQTVAETLQQILHTEPVPPRLLNPSVPRDLETICLKCLEKDPRRRYETAHGLATELERFLNNEPVLAQPPTRLYRFQKLARRNKVPFTAAAAILLALVAGLGVATWGLLRERAARARAEAAEQAARTEVAKFEQVAQFLKDMLKGVEPSVALGRDTTLLRDILDKTAERLDKELKDQPTVEAELRETIGNVYQGLAEFVKAEAMYRQVLSLRKKALGDKHLDVATALDNLATALGHQGKYAEAEALYRKSLAIRKQLSAVEHPQGLQGLTHLAGALDLQGKYAEAEAILRESLALQKRLFGNDHPDVAESLNNLATVLYDQGQFAEAELCYRQALAVQKKLVGNEHPHVATTLYNIASILQAQSKSAEAEALYREALAMQKKLLGNDHPDVAFSLTSLAITFQTQGKYAEAEAQIREALTLREKRLGKEHPLVTDSLANLAAILLDQGKNDDAEAIQREALAREKKLHGDEHPEVAESLNNLAGILRSQNKNSEAEAIHREAIAMARKLLGDEHPNVALFLNNFGSTLIALGNYAEAEAANRESLAIKRKLLGEDHPAIADSLNDLGAIFSRLGNYVQAEPLHREALAIRRKKFGDTHPLVVVSLNNVAEVLGYQGKYAEAESLYREAMAITRNQGTDDPLRLENLENCLFGLANALYRQRKHAEAEPLYRKVLESRCARLGAGHEDMINTTASVARFLTDWAWAEHFLKSEIRNPKSEMTGRAREAEALLRDCLGIRLRGTNATHWRTDDVKSRLGGALLSLAVTDPALGAEARQSKFAEAETLLLQSNGRLQQSKSAEPRLKREALERLVRLYEAWDAIAPNSGKSARAEEWKKMLEASRARTEDVSDQQKSQ
jgi:tetratricopeptide (TPR) repeat protein/tRNA A-37 threonylcarbamoyl transferase component Bud32